MRKIILLLTVFVLSTNGGYTQPIPLGISRDSIPIPEIFKATNIQGFDIYKPQAYDPATSPIWFVLHGQGGTGAGTINNLSSIADRRNTLMIGISFNPPSATMQHQNAIVPSNDTNDICTYYLPGSLILKRVYRYICMREGRTSIPSYLSGFSAGAQFVSRYMLIRQAYPDSIPLQMSLSMSPLGYTFPTDTFLGVPLPYVCGLIMPQWQPPVCPHAYNMYSWTCNEQIVQYYNENYAVCVGSQDIANQLNGSCYDITGATRLDRARTFFAFCDSNAITRGTSLNWQYAEIPGAGHDEYACFQTKWLPTDTSTIAERILFETPYQPVTFTAPVANFYPDSITIQANDTVFFTNASINASAYLWDFGDSTYATSTLVNPYHVYSVPGTYSVELTAINANGCDNWYKRKHFIHVTSGVGLSELNSISLQIIPNPSNGNFTVYQSQSEMGEKLQLITLQGQEVYAMNLEKDSKIEIQLPNSLSNGIYMLLIQSQQGKRIGKVVVNR